MKIETYKTLISNLPVRQQCFTTKRSTWLNAEADIVWLKKLNDQLFGKDDSLTISRQDIFETEDLRKLILKTIYWGYSAGMRGNNFINILQNIKEIEHALINLKKIPNPTEGDYLNIASQFNSIKGIGPSTYSKLFYFLNISFNGNPCLILDQRLINVFASNTYSNFIRLIYIHHRNAEVKYLLYLPLMNQVAKDLETKGENIEQFLFTFGNNLKSSNH